MGLLRPSGPPISPDTRAQGHRRLQPTNPRRNADEPRLSRRQLARRNAERRRVALKAKREEDERRTEIVMRAVFETTELLEAIQLFLPPKDTIVCMRVCKDWHDCVHASPGMTKHLFLCPSGLLFQQFARTKDIPHPRGGPRALAKTFAPAVDWNQGRFLRGENPTMLTPIRVCPLLSPLVSAQPSTVHDLIPEYLHDCTAFSNTNIDQVGRWRAMLATDPPCFVAQIHIHFSHVDGPQNLDIGAAMNVRNMSGITVEDIWKAAMVEPLEQSCRILRARDRYEYLELKGVAMQEGLRQANERFGVPFEVWVTARFAGAVIPEEGEWAEIGCKKP